MEEAHSRLLIIFYRNPRKGKVKTRLAASLGDDEALRIYQALVSHTQDITRDLPFETVVYYSEKIDDTDVWSGGNHQKSLQQGNDLGQRMMDAFEAGFKRGHRSICIIGTDCYQLTRAVILSAFKGLLLHDAVIGPALDGGYYLIGMNRLIPAVFKEKRWSTDTVLFDTLRDFERMNISYLKLPELSDVDTEDDVPEELR